MPNPNAPFGFRPINRDGGPYTGQSIRVCFQATTGTACYIGDAVKLAGTGSPEGVLEVTQAATTNAIYGVITSFEASPDALGDQYRKASTLRYAQMVPANGNYFVVQSDDDTTALTADDCGTNANMILTETASTQYGISAMELDSSSANTTSTLDLQVVGLYQSTEQDVSAGTTAGVGGTNKLVVVKFNEPQGAPYRTGV